MTIANQGPQSPAERITHTTDDNLPPVIGIYANAPGAGKSEVAGMLGEWGYESHPFAAPLKHIVTYFLRELGYSHSNAADAVWNLKDMPLEDVYGLTPRHLLRTLGTEWGRDCVHPDVWVDAWKAKLPPLTVADDVRFPNEVHAIRAMGGVVWYVERPDAAGDTEHRSEGALSAIVPDAMLLNNGSLETLSWQVRARLEGECLRNMWRRRGMSVTVC